MSINDNSLNAPGGIAFDCQGNLWVADVGNNRVLMYKADRRNPELFYNGQAADIVLGQSKFTSNGAPDPPTASSLKNPFGLAFDACNLWVADVGNNRVLMYKADRRNPELFYNGQAADIVLGQEHFTFNSAPKINGAPPDFSPISEPLTPSVLQWPSHITFDSDRNLWAAGFARVLRFSFPNANSSGEQGSLVIGKPDFVTPDENPSPTTANSLWAASGIVFDQSGNMIISDGNAERILIYRADVSIPDVFNNGQAAFLVLGQTSVTSSGVDQAQPSRSNVFSPQSIAFDLEGNLWTTDLGFNRVLSYSQPFSTGQNADFVIGQSSFTTKDAPSPPNANSLNQPTGLAFDHSGNLWVADSDNNRILRYSKPFSNGQAANIVLGKQSFTSP